MPKVNKWLDNSEIVAGFVLRGKLDAHIVNPDDLYPPYNEIIPTVRDSKGMDEVREKVIEKHGYSIYRDAVSASESINSGTTPLNWLKMLEQSANRFKSGADIGKIADELQEGKEVNLGKLLQFTSQISLGYRALTPLSDVEPEKAQWIKTGYAPVDDFIGGVPKAGLTIVAASPGIGKTTFMLRVLLNMIRKYKKKKVAIFSLEMLMSQVVARYLDLDKKITIAERSRILASETAYSVGEVYALAARAAATENLAAIGIDFADLLVEGEQTEAVMGQIYRTLSVLAKQTGVPVILVCQLNRTTYLGGLPKINHIRYSGMAEMMASLILLLYNPNTIMADYKADTQLAAEEGRGYVLVGKSRFGFKMGSPVAIKVGWDGLAGWDEKSYGTYNING